MSELFPSSEQMQNADNYSGWTFELFQQFIRGKVLEVGCGVGTFTRLIAEHPGCESLHSIDTSQPAIDFVKARHLPPKVGIERIGLMDVHGEYDLVVCMNVLEHVENDREFFHKLFTLLNRNGVLFLLTPAHQWLYGIFDKANGHYRRYTKHSLNQYALPTGIKLMEQHYFNMIGAIGFWVTYKLLRKEPTVNPEKEIRFFDKVVVPFSRRMLPLHVPFGISLVSVYRNESVSKDRNAPSSFQLRVATCG